MYELILTIFDRQLSLELLQPTNLGVRLIELFSELLNHPLLQIHHVVQVRVILLQRHKMLVNLFYLPPELCGYLHLLNSLLSLR